MLILLNLLFLGLISFLLYKKSKQQSLRKHFWFALVVRVVAGIGLGLVYWFFYKGGDTVTLFGDGVALAKYAKQNPSDYLHFLFFDVWEEDQHVYRILQITNPRAVFMSKAISIVNLLTADNYWLTSVYFSLFSFAGSWFCANKLANTFRSYQSLVAFSFFYFPSFVFWSSGIIKESLLVGSIGFLVALLPFKNNSGLGVNRSSLWKILAFCLLSVLILKLKYYYLGGLLAAIFSYYLTQLLLPRKFEKWSYVSMLGFFTLILIGSTFFHPNLNIGVFLNALVKNNQIMVEATANESNLILFEGLTPDWTCVLKNIPKAVWEGMYRPYLWEEGHWLKRLSAIEAAFIFSLSIFSVPVFIKLLFKKKLEAWVIPVLLYSFLMLCILPIAAPNIGNLVRYKVGFSPFLTLLMLIGAVNFTDYFTKFRIIKRLF
ncbi:hypothetical protein R9C00_27240 [Flammeovirgaceae bacterium SG7u.111]|nr:hypothetical protein [Flammeovirgaceae bacterium SG7u.132]WPO35397.1 hypothetical protein R9C00_27240 [Flammeovirgaceae bacterium SG7u.111]